MHGVENLFVDFFIFLFFHYYWLYQSFNETAEDKVIFVLDYEYNIYFLF